MKNTQKHNTHLTQWETPKNTEKTNTKNKPKSDKNNKKTSSNNKTTFLQSKAIENTQKSDRATEKHHKNNTEPTKSVKQATNIFFERHITSQPEKPNNPKFFNNHKTQ